MHARLSPQRILMKTIVCVWAMHVCAQSSQRILMKTIVCVGYARLSPQRILMKTIVCVGYAVCTFVPTTISYEDNCVCGLCVCVGRGGALVKSMTLNRRVVCSTPALAATQGPWASPLLTVACALPR